MRSLLSLVFFLGLLPVSIYCLPAQADQFSMVEHMRKSSLSHPVLKGKFTQARQLKQVGATLNSSGTFVLDQKKGLFWKQTKPFEFTMTMGDEKIVTKMQGQAEKVLSKSSDPVIFSFANIFLSLFQGRVDRLQQHFSMHQSGSKANWSLVLTPKDKMIAKAIKQIVVSGKKLINAVEVTESRGDVLTIGLKY